MYIIQHTAYINCHQPVLIVISILWKSDENPHSAIQDIDEILYETDETK